MHLRRSHANPLTTNRYREERVPLQSDPAQSRTRSQLERNASLASSIVDPRPNVTTPRFGSTYTVMDQNQRRPRRYAPRRGRQGARIGGEVRCELPIDFSDWVQLLRGQY